MNNKIRESIFLIAIFFTMISSCQTPPDNGEITNIQVRTVSPEKTPGILEEFPLNNCGGNGKLTQSLGTRGTVSKSVKLGVTVTANSGSTIGIPEYVEVSLEKAIEGEYNGEFETASSRLDTITMEVAPNSHVIYTIQWEKQEFSSIVIFEYLQELLQTPYTYTLNVPKIIGSREVICDTTAPGSTSSPVPASLPISGVWEGTTTGIKGENIMIERLTTVTIPENCQQGRPCGTSDSVDSCNYQMTLSSIQGNTYTFDAELLSGPYFCYENSEEHYIQLIMTSENKVTYNYHAKHDDGTIVDRTGILTRK